MVKNIGIYKITSPTKKVYIGQSVNINHRFGKYKKLNCKTQTKLYRSFVKHGVDNHTFEVLEYCDVELLNEKERYYQDLYSAIGKNGLNCRLTKTNDRSGKMSQETKDKISKYWKGKVFSDETKNKISLALKGKKKSKQHIENYTKAMKNVKRKPCSDKTRESLSKSSFHAKLVLDMQTGIYYKSVKEACFVLDMKHSTLYSKLKGVNKNNTNYEFV